MTDRHPMPTPTTVRRRATLPLFLVAALASCRAAAPVEPAATISLEPRTCGAVQRLHALGEVYLGSQPDAEDLRAAHAMGVETIVSLRHAAETQDWDEEGLARGLGMDFVRIPWNGPGELSDEIFDAARDQLRGAARPLFLHCGSGNRVGAVWIPYRVLDQGAELEAAVAEAKVVGLKTPEFEAKARDYVARRTAGG
jgi:protein tyrosine phosphatase (PTP) superfamily phosphohydrolase (DUF442 family)